ncbi:MAG: hypothetical protein ABUL60_33680, partial [Myxococcales bacterium]
RTRGTADRAPDSDGAKDSERATAAATKDGAERGTESAEESTDGDRLPVGPIPRGLPPVTGPQHYQVQFSTVEEHVQLVVRAKELLARSRPGVTLGELHLEAMKSLVASLEKRRFAVTDRLQRHAPGRDIRSDGTAPESGTTRESKAVSSPRQRGKETAEHQRQRERESKASDIAPLDGEEINQDAATAPCQRDGETADVSPPRQRDYEANRRQHQRERECEREHQRKASDIAPLGSEEIDTDAAAALCQRGDEIADVSPPRRRSNETTEHQRQCEREREMGGTSPLGGEEIDVDDATALCGAQDERRRGQHGQRGDEIADVSPPRQRGNKTSKHSHDAGDATALDGEATSAGAEWPRQRGGEASRREPEIVEIGEIEEEGGDLVSPRWRGEPGGSRRGRYVPAVERREVYRRDDGRCTFVDARGERCCETRYLELHHLQPFARNGDSVAANLALRCAAHNALATEGDFGRQLIMARRDSPRHEAFARQRLVVFEEKS